jgi:hypothetical protein
MAALAGLEQEPTLTKYGGAKREPKNFATMLSY